MDYEKIMEGNIWSLMTSLGNGKYLPIDTWGKYFRVIYRMREGKMDEQDKADFKEMCQNSGDDYLIGLCEYEIRNAKRAANGQEKDLHMTLAEIAFSEMEKREIA